VTGRSLICRSESAGCDTGSDAGSDVHVGIWRPWFWRGGKLILHTDGQSYGRRSAGAGTRAKPRARDETL
jgi:hypothetical protein